MGHPIPSFGPRLSDAAAWDKAAIGAATPTDILFPSAELESTSTTQVKNILSVISLGLGGVQSICFRMRVLPFSAILDTDLKFYDYNADDEFLLEFTDTTDTNGYLTVVYEPAGTQGTDTAFLYCGYNTTDDVAQAKNAIMADVLYGTLPEGIEINSTDDYALTSVELLMGDVDGNNVVEEADQTIILSSIQGDVVLTQQQILAADVNFDGAVNATDWLRIDQYIQGTLSSFWGTTGIVPISTSSSLVDGACYKIFNKDNGYYLLAYDDSDSISLGNSSTSVVTNNFIINASGGLCTIEIFSAENI